MPRVRRGALGATLLAWVGGCGGNPGSTSDSESGVVTTSTESGSEDSTSTDESTTDESTNDESTTDEPYPECDWTAVNDCIGPAEFDYLDCVAACPSWLLDCDDGDCAASCGITLSAIKLACELQHCTVPREEPECVHECWTNFSSCLTPSCDLHACQWELGPCVSHCVLCTVNTELDFAYANSCELLLPEPVDIFRADYLRLVLNEQDLDIEQMPSACDDPQVGGIVMDDVVSLCPAACESFALAGVLRIRKGGPTCP
jgi:hypothetical protein